MRRASLIPVESERKNDTADKCVLNDLIVFSQIMSRHREISLSQSVNEQ